MLTYLGTVSYGVSWDMSKSKLVCTKGCTSNKNKEAYINMECRTKHAAQRIGAGALVIRWGNVDADA
jgi:hypothetical protein